MESFLTRRLNVVYADFEIRRNKTYKDRYQLIGRTVGGQTPENYLPVEGKQYCSHNHGLGSMSNNGKSKAEEEIDDIVTAQAEIKNAWEEPIQVRRSSSQASIREGFDDPIAEHAFTRTQETSTDLARRGLGS